MSVRSLARELGVSATAVSLALKGSPRVSAELRAEVQRRARAAGHVPNARLAELMSEVRHSGAAQYRATLGVISLFPEERPWIERPIYAHLAQVLAGARTRAQAHGYKLEEFWVKQPGLTPERLGEIIDARGISGLLCLGSLDPDERFPPALQRFVVVTHAASIPDPMHRVLSDFARDGRLLYEELVARGYRQPGLCILGSGDRRTDHLYSATFLSHQERRFAGARVPVLRAEEWNEPEFAAWFDRHEPDVIVLHQYATYTTAVEAFLARRKLRVPRDVGLALLDKMPAPRFSGIRQDPFRIGAVATEMLLGRLLLRDFGRPGVPKIELVPGEWNEGETLRARRG